MKLFLVIIFSFTLSANDSLLKQYLKFAKDSSRTHEELSKFLEKKEKNFFKMIAKLSKELQFSTTDNQTISPENNLALKVDHWTEHSKKKKIKKKLQKLIENPEGFKTYKSIFKENRKYAHLLREAFYVFDKTHKTPKKLESFVTQYGKLNDAISSKNIELIYEHAKKTLNAYNKISREKILNDFKIVKPSQFLSYFKSIKKEVFQVLEKSSHSTHDYHFIRKKFKRYLYVYFHIDSMEQHPKLKLLDDYISKLGDLNDIYVDMKFKFAFDVKNHLISFPKKFKKEIQQTFEYLEEDIKGLKFKKGCLRHL